MKMARLIDGTKKLQVVVVVDVEVLGLLICEISFRVRSLKKTFTFFYRGRANDEFNEADD